MAANDAPIQYAKSLTPGKMTVAGRRIGINTTLPGNVAMTLSSGDVHVIPVVAGYQEFDYSVVMVSSGKLTTAMATFTNLS